MKPITELDKLVLLAEQQNICPFTNNKQEYKFLWVGEFTKFGCDLLRTREDFDEHCTFMDFRRCPLGRVNESNK